MKVHIFGAVSSPSCYNFALKQTAKDHTNEFDDDITNIVKTNFYVNDLLLSVDDEEE